ncbi:MAG: DUF2971 domain-containing protein [Verrucomicrobiia bacterium]
MIIYQYRDEGGLCVLRTGELRLSLLDSFNDPFELAPSAIDFSSMTKEHCIEFVTERFDEWYERDGQFRGLGDKETCRKILLTNPSRIADLLVARLPENVEWVRSQFAAYAKPHWAIGCFSKRNDSILMWAHYAKQHTGLVIGYDTDQEPFSLTGKYLDLLEVEYRDCKPIYHHRHDVDEFQKEFFAAAKSKFTDWQYEQEVRIIVPRTSLREGRFMCLRPQSVASVIFGCRCPLSTKQAAMQYLNQDRLKHVAIYTANQNKEDYKLDLVELRKGACG